MGSEYAVWVPTLVTAHLIGFALLLYSLQQVGGHLSKTWRRVFGPKNAQSQIVLDVESGEKVAAGDTVELTATTGLDIEADGVKNRPYPARLAWKDITCRVLDTSNHQQKTVLTSCSGMASPGETVALMGPSGAGKTTLLDAIAGRKSRGFDGTVTLNGATRGKVFRRISAYVPQEDSFVATLTALETVKFRANLTIPRSVPKAVRNMRIAAVLETMGLSKVQHTKVGGLLPGGIVVRGLSGGEKKRLSIACALISNPSILFLDEPTTGLDSFAALNVMEHMSKLAILGHTVIASIHQPRTDIFNKFNKVSILSEGHQVYMGPPAGCLDWFQGSLKMDYDPKRDGMVSDWVMDTVSVGFHKPTEMASRSMTTVTQVREAASHFRTLSNAHENPMYDGISPRKLKDPSQAEKPGAVTDDDLRADAANHKEAQQWASSKYAVSWLRQYRVLFKRALLSQLRNPSDTSGRLLMSTWVGTLAGLVFASLPEGSSSTQQRLALMFFVLLLYQLMPFCFMSFFVADRRFFQADVAAGLYEPSAYYLAAVTASMPFVILNTTCGGLMAFGLTGLRYTGYAIIMYVIVLCLQALISNQLQIFCVWLTPNQDMAYTLATGYVAASILLSGFYLRISAIKIGFIRGLSWLSYTKYAMQAMGRIELLGRTWDPSTCAQTPDPITGQLSTDCITSGQQMLDYYGYTINTGILIAALIAAFAIFHVGSYLSLSRLYRQR